MEKFLIKKWDENKEHLKEFISNKPIDSTCGSYEQMVKTLINECINYGGFENNCDYYPISENFNVIDHGDYQGTQLFILHSDVYQPSVSDYFIFDNNYGSCSGCDTLLRIIEFDYDQIPNDYQVENLMKLFLHMIQRIKCLSRLYE